MKSHICNYHQLKGPHFISIPDVSPIPQGGSHLTCSGGDYLSDTSPNGQGPYPLS